MKNILICGCGNIGTHVYDELKNLKYTNQKSHTFFKFYDIKKPSNYEMSRAWINKENIKKHHHFDIAFVCVSTEMLTDGSCDISQVEDVLKNVDADIFVIKSTVPVGTCDNLQKRTKKKIVFSPEFWGTTIHSIHPNFMILSGRKEYCDKIADLYHLFKCADFKIVYTDFKTAELAKYMENCFLATKVTFCSEFYEIAKDIGVSYNELRELFVLDDRMGKSHTLINPQSPFYDSHCLNKDIPAFVKFCHNKKTGLGFMDTINLINQKQKKKYKNIKRGGLNKK